MTLMEFFGCTFLAFGPALAMFIFTIARDPLRVIVLMASAFFWLLALLLSSLLWFAVVPLREELAFGLVFSVIFQEGFRLLFYFILKKAEAGLKKFSEREGDSGVTIVSNKHLLAYAFKNGNEPMNNLQHLWWVRNLAAASAIVGSIITTVAGFGFGIISGAFSLVNVLADMSGPGTIGIKGDSSMFFITSALLTLCFIFLHTFWGIMFFAGMNQKKYHYVVAVVLSHMLVSCLSLLNQGTNPVYLATVITPYVIMVVMGILSFFIAGGSFRNIKSCLGSSQGGYDM